MFLTRLGRHYQFAAAQRLALSYLWVQAAQDPKEVTLMSIDKMDQSKTMIPRVHSLLKTQIMKAEGRLVVGLVGVLLPGIFGNPTSSRYLRMFHRAGTCSLALSLRL